jgi:hypothetical protein
MIGILNRSATSSALAALGVAVCVLLPQHALADAPVGHFSVARGTVKDWATELIWQQEPSDTTYGWDDAVQYCKDLDLDGPGWRLPTVKELHTLVDESRAMPAIDRSAFPRTASDNYWSASHVVSFAQDAWAVSFAYGFDTFFQVSAREHVRCVR